MRVIYVLAVVFMVFIILLLAGSFVYLEKWRHQTLIFIISRDGRDIGDVKIDRYKTEEKTILTSSERRFFEPGLTGFQKKLVLDRKTSVLENYAEINSGAGSGRQILIENKNSSLNFLSIAFSEFSAISQPFMKTDYYVYDIDNLLLYMPIIARYNFRRGGSQSFKAICYAGTFLPPYKKTVVLTSIRDEYIDVLGKKTKTECLIVKSKLMPEAELWVSKSDHSIARFRIPKLGIEFRRTDALSKFEVKEYNLLDPSYSANEISFKSGDIALSGVLTVPNMVGSDKGHPAILLISERGFFNRDCAGIFCDLADYLSKKGFIAMRFDKRGTGTSQGNETAATLADDLEDARQALNYLSGFDKVDKTKIAVLGYGEGAYLAARLASDDKSISSCILMAYNPPVLRTLFETESLKEKIKELADIDPDYPDSIARLREQTNNYAREAKKDWVQIFDKKVFLKRVQEKSYITDAEIFGKINVPLLILQGKRDKDTPADYLKPIQQKIVYFRNLGHYFGALTAVDDTKIRQHYSIDKEVPAAIFNWLDDNLLKKAALKAPEGEQEPLQNPAKEFDKQQNM